MTKPCPDDLAAFKHEPADYEQPLMADHVTVEQLAACPFCGSGDVELRESDGWQCACNNCGARTGKAWSLIDGKQRAIAAWNTRTQANEAMRLREALSFMLDVSRTVPGFSEMARKDAERALSEVDAVPQAAAMREALERISNAHLPDQPATSSLDETEWAIQHIRRIRAIARAALSGDST